MLKKIKNKISKKISEKKSNENIEQENSKPVKEKDNEKLKYELIKKIIYLQLKIANIKKEIDADQYYELNNKINKMSKKLDESFLK